MQHQSRGENTEEVMIALLMRNDQQSFFKLYAHYAPTLFGIINNIIENREIAESVLQNCFTQIRSNRKAFDSSKENLFSWMYKITKNLALQSRVQDRIIDFSQPEKENLALNLIFIHGYSFQEVANQMKVSTDHLKSKIRTTLQAQKNSTTQ